WSHFTTDILIHVASKHVTSAATYATLRGVCRSWRAALPATVPGPHRLPPQLPFLLLFFSRCRADDPAHPAFFSLTSNRTFALRHLADAHESVCIGSCYGWLFLLFPDFNLVLRNPVTGDTIRLPPLDGTIGLASPDPFMRNLLFEHHFFIRRAILSSDPSADCDFLVALFVDTATSRCLTWGSGDRLWTIREHP
ncbi:F-box protein At1g10110-like, partial [Ananas comosus]|uniref:F-box protein At1g10110-like n=1 Tax=Ananas comosus TaxID=4615 RepID=A0A6P5EED0_ANACO